MADQTDVSVAGDPRQGSVTETVYIMASNPELKGISIRKMIWATTEFIPDREDGECWPWVGSMYGNGYGRLRVRVGDEEKNFMAHRISYTVFRGSIEDELTLDHLCGNRACCNPDHLQPVTRGINAARGQGWVGGTCKRNHLLTAENIYVAPGSGKRQCRSCWSERPSAKRRP